MRTVFVWFVLAAACVAAPPQRPRLAAQRPALGGIPQRPTLPPEEPLPPRPAGEGWQWDAAGRYWWRSVPANAFISPVNTPAPVSPPVALPAAPAPVYAPPSAFAAPARPLPARAAAYCPT